MLMHSLCKGLLIREGNQQACDNLMCAVERCINESYFGVPEAPSAWQCSVNDDNTMGDISWPTGMHNGSLQH